MRGDIRRWSAIPASRIPMRSADGAAPASHALPGTPQAGLVQLSVNSLVAAEAD